MNGANGKVPAFLDIEQRMIDIQANADNLRKRLDPLVAEVNAIQARLLQLQGAENECRYWMDLMAAQREGTRDGS